MVAHAYPHALAQRRSRIRWGRLPLVVVVVAVVTGLDTATKRAAVLAGHGALDAPTSLVKPLGTPLVCVVALAAALVLPRLCVPGALAALAGASSNLISLAAWHAVPNPYELAVAGGYLHFNLADVCVAGGSLLFLAALLWTLWRMPDDEFARLVGNAPALPIPSSR